MRREVWNLIPRSITDSGIELLGWVRGYKIGTSNFSLQI